MKRITQKHKASSIETKAPNLEIKPTSTQDKKDFELLELGIRKDGGAQLPTKKVKKNLFKSTELDIGKYMSTGYSVNTAQAQTKDKKGLI